MLKDNEVLKIQGISKEGFWMRLYKTKPYMKFVSEVWVSSAEVELLYFPPQNIKEAKINPYPNRWALMSAKVQEMRDKRAKGESSFTQGELLMYKTIDGKAYGFPVVDIPVSVDYTDGAEIDDQVVKALHDVQNKCNAIDALFESIDNDLDYVCDHHFDSNSFVAAHAVRKKFKKLHETFYEQTVEPDRSDDDDQNIESLLGMLYYLERNNHQVAVIPEIRRSFQEDILRVEIMSPEEKADLEELISDIRDQFGIAG